MALADTSATRDPPASRDLLQELLDDRVLLGAFVVCVLLIGYQLSVTLLQPPSIQPVTTWLPTALVWLQLLVVAWVAVQLLRTHQPDAATWCCLALGVLADLYGRPKEAAGYYEQALAIYREMGDRAREGTTLSKLAHARPMEEAARYYEQALAIFEEIGEPDSARVVRGHLEALQTSPARSEPNDSAPEHPEPVLAPEPASPVATASGKRRRWWRIGR